MVLAARIRLACSVAALAGVATALACGQHQAAEPAPRQAPAVQHPAPQQQPSTSTLTPIQRRQHPGAAANNTGEHLAEWMNRHSNLTPQQQQEALEKEPGFKDLPSQTRQRMRDRLTQLNKMPTDKRQQILARNEAMEHLTPEQRTQVRSAMKELADLPTDQRRYVARTFRGLRELSPAQRENVLNSDRFNHLTPEQRSTLTDLMRVEPLLPPPYDGAPPPQP